MSDYLFATMGKGPTGTPDSRFSIKNSFMVSTAFALPVHNTGDLNIVSKIDTGCQFTSFSYRRLVDLADDIMAAKQLASEPLFSSDEYIKSLSKITYRDIQRNLIELCE